MTRPEPIPLVDLKAQFQSLRDELLGATLPLIEEGRFIGGEPVARFESEFARYCGSRHAIGVANGTDALQLVLRSLEIGFGDEVITVPSSFVATAEGVLLTGATVRYVDVDPETWTMDPKLLEAAITKRTRAIIPVHLYGCPADMEPILEIANKHHLVVIEDACQAHGARIGGKRAGAMGRAGCFSFYPGKNLGAMGDGGAVVTDDDRLAELLKKLRDHGRSSHAVHDMVGTNSRLDSLQAAVLSVKLGRLDPWNQRRRELAARYHARLSHPKITLPTSTMMERSVFHLFTVLVPDRDRVLKDLNDQGVGAGCHYPFPIHRQLAYRDPAYPEGSLPHGEHLAARTLSLPIYPEMTEAQQDRVIHALLATLG